MIKTKYFEYKNFTCANYDLINDFIKNNAVVFKSNDPSYSWNNFMQNMNNAVMLFIKVEKRYIWKNRSISSKSHTLYKKIQRL